jgi:hypothetical protein
MNFSTSAKSCLPRGGRKGAAIDTPGRGRARGRGAATKGRKSSRKASGDRRGARDDDDDDEVVSGNEDDDDDVDSGVEKRNKKVDAHDDEYGENEDDDVAEVGSKKRGRAPSKRSRASKSVGNGVMSEDEALQRALKESLADQRTTVDADDVRATTLDERDTGRRSDAAKRGARKRTKAGADANDVLDVGDSDDDDDDNEEEANDVAVNGVNAVTPLGLAARLRACAH